MKRSGFRASGAVINSSKLRNIAFSFVDCVSHVLPFLGQHIAQEEAPPKLETYLEKIEIQENDALLPRCSPPAHGCRIIAASVKVCSSASQDFPALIGGATPDSRAPRLIDPGAVEILWVKYLT